MANIQLQHARAMVASTAAHKAIARAQANSTYKRLPVTRAEQTATYANMTLSAPSQGARRFVFYAPMRTTWRQQQHVVDIIAQFWSSEFWQVHPDENENDEAGHIDYFAWVAATILFELQWGAILSRTTNSTKEAKQASGQTPMATQAARP